MIPFKIPKDKYDDFLEDYIEVLKDIELIDKVSNNDSPKNVKFNYRLLVVYGNKPSNRVMSNFEGHFKNMSL